MAKQAKDMAVTVAYDTVSLRKDLGSKALIDKIRKIIGRDRHGRPIPDYAILHDALVLYHAHVLDQKHLPKAGTK